MHSFPSLEAIHCSMSTLTVAFWPAYRFLRRQVMLSGVPVSRLFKNVPVCCNWHSQWLWSEITHSCPTLCDLMDCSLPGSSVHGTFQARGLEWVAISFSRGSSPPRDRTQVSCSIGRRFTVWATREVLSIVNKAEVDVFLELSCFFYDPMDVGNLISGSSTFSKSNLNI